MRVLAVSAALLTGVWIFFVAKQYHLDLDVYRIGVNVWLSGGDMYGTLPATDAGIVLPFIYPPFSAIAMVPLTVIPFGLASTILAVLTVGLTGVTLAVLLSSVNLPVQWLMLLPVALFLEPFRETMSYGQINVILMALVVVDCLVRKPRWPRGALVGIAAALKLTPAAFVLFFLLRRDWKSLSTAGISFVVTTGLGFALAWDRSVDFWTNAVFTTDQKVGVGYISNQSIMGLLTRADAKWLYPILALVVVVLAVLAMRRTLHLPTTAFALNALAMLLVSPISWSHHWVWCLPVIVAFAVQGFPVMAFLGAAVFMVAPHWLSVPVLVDAYFGYAVLALAVPLIKKRVEAPELTMAGVPDVRGGLRSLFRPAEPALNSGG
ncbi:glycosyltransferase 87 family protein [Actinokineospora enzanensis]|uniref:glycosyltransferase 87 family protein n=1 Tax=Actinokineospora enzanensis TaxID=155975 RepID=UPI000371FFEB|nr:glycosyltransferase 87 family protein [Actinokineospora enzanensis]